MLCCLAVLLLLLLLCRFFSAFSPLEGFMNQAEYDNVVHNMRLTVSGGGRGGLKCVCGGRGGAGRGGVLRKRVLHSRLWCRT